MDQKNQNDLVFWIGLIIAFCIAPPIGIIMLVLRFCRGSAAQKQSPAVHGEPSAPRPAQQAAQAPKKQPRRKRYPSIHAGRWQIILGAILAACGAYDTVDTLLQYLSAPFLVLLRELYQGSAFLLGAGAALLIWGLTLRRRSRRGRKYLSVIGQKDALYIDELAKAMPASYNTACEELQSLIDHGYLEEYSYLDLSRGQLVVRGDGIQPEPEPEPEPQDDDALLLRIRRVNDAIANPTLSAQIDRIEEITRRILAYQKDHPDQTQQLRTFLDYYLPTTLKILNSYAELERQGVEGENISATKARIEGMMAMVVSGFEKQLDKLFAAERMDISTDISVMEQMLRRDGLDRESPWPAPQEKATASKGV